MSWYHDLDVEINKQKLDKEKSDAMRLHVAKTLSARASEFWQQLNLGAQQGIEMLKRGHPEFSEVTMSSGVGTFTVVNLAYPVVKMAVTRTDSAIHFAQSVTQDANSSAQESAYQILMSLDRNDKLALIHDGQAVVDVDAALHLILKPVFHV